MEIMRAPNSTPIVRSWTGWKRLSVNWSRRQDLPTPVRGVTEHRFASVGGTILLKTILSQPEIDNCFAPGEANQTYFKFLLTST
eukprot:scaffold16692_cov84-Skeletonema_dohrnii-CCMP3373.AAC.3